MSPDDWAEFAAGQWRHGPVRLPARSVLPVSVADAWRLVRQAAAPFQSGTRFRVLPDVRYFESNGQLRAPGAALPGDADRTLHEYLRRLDGRPHLLVVTQPLVLDFDSWRQVRELIEPLWARVGVPVAAMTTQLTVTDGLAEPWSSSGMAGHDVFSWVLSGDLWADSLHGSAGDLLYWPAENQPRTIHGQGCLVLRLLVPTDSQWATLEVAETVDATLQRRRESFDVPYLPARSAGTVMAPVATLADEVAGLLNDGELERQLRIRWAKRVSAAALEPVPAPRPSQLTAGALVESTSPVLRLAEPDNRWIWATNGHAFTVSGSAGDRAIEQLRSARIRIGDDVLLPLFRKLHALGAVELVDEGSD